MLKLNHGSCFLKWSKIGLVYSRIGNSGSGLGNKFGHSLSSNIVNIFRDLGKERVTQGTHIEKACLFGLGIGKDNISDFTYELNQRVSSLIYSRVRNQIHRWEISKKNKRE